MSISFDPTVKTIMKKAATFNITYYPLEAGMYFWEKKSNYDVCYLINNS